MKKFLGIALLLSVMMCAVFTGCKTDVGKGANNYDMKIIVTLKDKAPMTVYVQFPDDYDSESEEFNYVNAFSDAACTVNSEWTVMEKYAWQVETFKMSCGKYDTSFEFIPKYKTFNSISVNALVVDGENYSLAQSE